METTRSAVKWVPANNNHITTCYVYCRPEATHLGDGEGLVEKEWKKVRNE